MSNTKPNNDSGRRDFSKKELAASTLFIVPRNVVGGIGYTAPSD